MYTTVSLTIVFIVIILTMYVSSLHRRPRYRTPYVINLQDLVLLIAESEVLRAKDLEKEEVA